MTEATVSTERMEVRLLRWGENNSSGQTVTFQISEDVHPHPFKGYASGEKNGQRFILVVAPLDDNEENIPTEAVKRKKAFHELPRAQQAGILCGDPRFRRWIAEQYPVTYETMGDPILVLRDVCKVPSRSELDTKKGASEIWDALVLSYREETQLPDRR